MHISLQYHSKGEPPVLGIELLQAFALKDTPHVNDGKTSVVVDLVSPDLTLIHAASDLNSFWSDVYPVLKEELKRKHNTRE